MKIFVSAAEISSDIQAEKIVRALVRSFPQGSVSLSGIGGPKLRSIPGFKHIERAENLRAMGLVEVVSKLRFIKKTLHHVIDHLVSSPPDLILTFDYPEFHFELLKRIHKTDSLKTALKVCGIPPKVWVWRSHRVEKIRKYYDGVWVIFPFEKKFYEDLGIPVIYEGNPLIADLLSKATGIAKLESRELIHLAVMPGSREAELKYHLPVVRDALEKIAEKTGKKVNAHIPIPEGLPLSRFNDVLKDTTQVIYDFKLSGTVQVLAQNTLGLIKSGTSTLEAAVLGCAPIIFYKGNFISVLVFNWVVRYLGPVGLPNILLKIKRREDVIFPEILGFNASADRLAEEVLSIHRNENRLIELQNAGKKLSLELAPDQQIAEQVAKKIIQWKKVPPPRLQIRTSHFWIRTLSFFWSSINLLRRKMRDMGLIRSQKIAIPSVLVGNLQAGGAGKTPLVIEISKEAVSRGYRVGVISRGFGRIHPSDELVLDQNTRINNPRLTSDLIGDEPTEILNAVPEVTLGLGSNRNRLAELLRQRGINFLVFDDGFQNLKFRPSYTVLAVTDARPSEVIYRDFPSISKLANLLIQTKGYQKSFLEPQFKVEWMVENLPKQPIWLLCGVADPFELVQFYERLDVKIERVMIKPDHHHFKAEEVKKLLTLASESGCQLAITEKDRVKLPKDLSSTLFVLKRKVQSRDWLDFIFEHLQ